MRCVILYHPVSLPKGAWHSNCLVPILGNLPITDGFPPKSRQCLLLGSMNNFWGVGLWKEDILGQMRNDGESISACNMCLWIWRCKTYGYKLKENDLKKTQKKWHSDRLTACTELMALFQHTYNVYRTKIHPTSFPRYKTNIKVCSNAFPPATSCIGLPWIGASTLKMSSLAVEIGRAVLRDQWEDLVPLQRVGKQSETLIWRAGNFQLRLVCAPSRSLPRPVM